MKFRVKLAAFMVPRNVAEDMVTSHKLHAVAAVVNLSQH